MCEDGVACPVEILLPSFAPYMPHSFGTETRIMDANQY